MIINPIHSANIHFASKREDNNYLKKLSSSNSSTINENTQINLIKVLDALSNDPSVQNIKFLLNTAQNLNYGVKKNSEFKKHLLKSSPISTKPFLANEDWEERLKNATERALALNTSANKTYLNRKFNKIFNKNIPLTETQKNILQLRKNVLNSKVIKTSDDYKNIDKIKENLDYFIFSSEISDKEKLECLKKFAYFLSSKYSITPQLKDKKVQVLDEILNDIIIQNPNEAALTIKSVNQLDHGMCAAISASRKLAAYTDKINYLDSILGELNSSKTMKVYDITKLGSGEKITVEKIDVDFDSAIAQGYRIIDASATQWMHNAKIPGDGSLGKSYYQAFDNDNYGIFRDAFWLDNFPSEFKNVHKMLICSIKAREFAEEIEKNLLNEKNALTISKSNINDYAKQYQRARKALLSELKDIAPDLSNESALNLSTRIFSLEHLNKNVVTGNYSKFSNDKLFAIHPNEPEEIKKEKIKLFLATNLKEHSPNLTEGYIDALYEKYVEAKNLIAEINSVKKGNSLPMQVAINADLFHFGIAYRRLIEASLNDVNYLKDMYKELKLPDRNVVFQKYFSKRIQELDMQNDSKLIEKYAKFFRTKPNKQVVLEKMKNLKSTYATVTNKKLNSICSDLGYDGQEDLLIRTLSYTEELIKADNKEAILDYAQKLNTKAERTAVLNKLKMLKKEVTTNPSAENLDNIVQLFEVDNMSEFLMALIMATITIKHINEFENPVIAMLAKEISQNVYRYNVEKAFPKAESINQKRKKLEKILNIPSEKELVLGTLANRGEILSEKEIKDLGNKFLMIRQYKNHRDNSVEKVKNYDIFIFSKFQKESLNKVRKNFHQAKKYVNKTYLDLNKLYKEEIDAIYKDLGIDNVNIWESEEGHSGLYTYETIRIIERITGKPFYIEHDFLRASKEIQKGVGGAEVLTHVRDSGYSGHAQYVPAITKHKFINPDSQKAEYKNVVWHDNTWGNIERRNSWIDENNVARTDYNSSTGGPDGFILRNNNQNGWDVNYMLYGTGEHIPDDIKTLKNPLEEVLNAEKYSMFMGSIVAGIPTIKGDNNSTDLMKEIKFNRDKSLAQLRKRIEQGDFPDTQKQENLTRLAESNLIMLEKTIENIKTKEDFEKLSVNSDLKLILEKMAIANTQIGEANEDLISALSSKEDIETFKKQLLDKNKSFVYDYLGLTNNLLVLEDISDVIHSEIYDFQENHHYPLGNLADEIDGALKIRKSEINNPKSLKEIYTINLFNLIDKNVKNQRIKQTLKNNLLKTINKSFSEIYNPNFVLNDHNYKNILKLIDNKFNPSSDAEVKRIIQSLQNKKINEVKSILKDVTLSDFGIEFEDGWHYLNLVKANNHHFETIFRHYALSHYINKNEKSQYILPEIALGNKYSPKDFLRTKSVENIYQKIYNMLTYSDIEKKLEDAKEIFWKKYGVHSASPISQSISNEKITELLDVNIQTLESLATKYAQNRNSQDLLTDISSFKAVYSPNRKLYPQDYYELILPILKKMSANPTMKTNNTYVENILNLIFETPQFAYEVIPQYIELLNDEFEKINLTKANKDLAKANSNIIQGITNLINEMPANFILPVQKQGYYKSLLKTYTKEIMQNPDNSDIPQIKDKIYAYTQRYFPLKRPAILLNEYINLLKENVTNKTNNNKSLIKNYETNLEILLNESYKNKFKFDILDSVQDGKLYDFKNTMNDISIMISDGSNVKMNSDRGLQILFSTLYNSTENNKMEMINLLCKHTGLSENFFEAISKNAKYDIYGKLFSAFEKRVNKLYDEAMLIDKIHKMAMYDENCHYIDNILYFYSKLETAFANKNSKAFQYYISASQKMLPTFMNLVNQNENMLRDGGTMIDENFYQDLFKVQHYKSLNAIVNAMDPSIKRINARLNGICDDINILNALELNQYSPKYNEQKNILEKLNNWYEFSTIMAQEASKKLNALYEPKYDELIKTP